MRLDMTTYGEIWHLAISGEVCLDVTTYCHIWPHMAGMARYSQICCGVAVGMPDSVAVGLLCCDCCGNALGLVRDCCEIAVGWLLDCCEFAVGLLFN